MKIVVCALINLNIGYVIASLVGTQTIYTYMATKETCLPIFYWDIILLYNANYFLRKIDECITFYLCNIDCRSVPTTLWQTSKMIICNNV